MDRRLPQIVGDFWVLHSTPCYTLLYATLLSHPYACEARPYRAAGHDKTMKIAVPRSCDLHTK